jgi:hypothetical protein
MRSTGNGRFSIYMQQRRSETPTLFEGFDFPQLNPACLERSRSNVATQALALLNDGMVRNLAAAFATRVEKEAGDDPAHEIEQVYWIALSRPPSPQERKASLESLAELRRLAGGGRADHKALAPDGLQRIRKLSGSPTRSRLGRVVVLVGINGNAKESNNCRRCCGGRVLCGQGAAVG